MRERDGAALDNWRPDALGFVLVSAAIREERNVYRSLCDLKERAGIHARPVYVESLLPGVCDAIVKIEGEDYQAMGDYVSNVIRVLPGVVDIKTLTVTKPE
ncbi:MAG: Lrp/AsnC family transcriptional regulator [Candidatus Aenigmarchaeota archaeon]|nr:Lrp/AsnC family transcriptional regulator [Candidatus Aenigmarchaeota archaeon]